MTHDAASSSAFLRARYAFWMQAREQYADVVVGTQIRSRVLPRSSHAGSHNDTPQTTQPNGSVREPGGGIMNVGSLGAIGSQHDCAGAPRRGLVISGPIRA